MKVFNLTGNRLGGHAVSEVIFCTNESLFLYCHSGLDPESI